MVPDPAVRVDAAGAAHLAGVVALGVDADLAGDAVVVGGALCRPLYKNRSSRKIDSQIVISRE